MPEHEMFRVQRRVSTDELTSIEIPKTTTYWTQVLVSDPMLRELYKEPLRVPFAQQASQFEYHQ